MRLRRAWQRLSGERGQDAAEYAVLIGFIAVVIALAVGLLGINLNEVWQALGERLADAFAALLE